MFDNKMKKTEVTVQRAFQLHSVEEQENKKNSAVAFIVDWIFLWLYLIGTTGWLISTFRIPVSAVWFPGLMGAVSLLALVANSGRDKARFLKLAVWCGILVLAALLFRDVWISGLHILYNHAVDALGERYPYLFPFYRVSVEESMETFSMYFSLTWLSAIMAALGNYLIRTGNRILLGIQLAIFLLTQMIVGIAPDLLWNVATVLCLLSVWIRGHGERIPKGRQRLASLETFILAVAMATVLLLAGGLALSKTSILETDLFAGWKENWKNSIDDIRYGSGDTVMPEGQFLGLGSFETKKEPVLEVTMSKPESYYLRGYTGSKYTGTGWTDIDSEQIWRSRNLFYWLHQDDFYGQECLGDAAVALDAEVAAEEKNTLAIKNLAASSKYYYVPYELQSMQEEDIRAAMDAQKIGDAGLIAGGLQGSREYSYQALLNQVTKYPAYDAKLLDEDNLTEAGRSYKRKEEYYNEFVYSTYLDIPENLQATIHSVLGAKEIEAGDKHVDYAQAKQNILYVLTSDYTNTDQIEETWDGTNFIFDFLEFSKKGYSVHFASAATMMFRYYGIPARYVEGYLITPEDVKGMTAGEPYVLDDTHAHAWVEYYQDGVGWLPFETTPSYLNIMDKADEFQDISGLTGQGTENSSDDEEEEPEEDEEEEKEDEIDWLAILEIVLIVGICILLLVMFIFFIWVLLQRHKNRKAKALFTSSDKRAAVRALFEYSMNILSVAGLNIRNTSLYNYKKPLVHMFDEITGTEYEEIVHIRQEAVYSEHEIEEEQRAKMETFKNKIWNRVYKKGSLIQKFQLKYIYFL